MGAEAWRAVRRRRRAGAACGGVGGPVRPVAVWGGPGPLALVGAVRGRSAASVRPVARRGVRRAHRPHSPADRVTSGSRQTRPLTRPRLTTRAGMRLLAKLSPVCSRSCPRGGGPAEPTGRDWSASAGGVVSALLPAGEGFGGDVGVAGQGGDGGVPGVGSRRTVVSRPGATPSATTPAPSSRDQRRANLPAEDPQGQRS